jgi:hypothetical protein
MLFQITLPMYIYIKQNKPDKALEYASRSLKLAQKYGLKKQISISNENYQNCTRNGTMKKKLTVLQKFIVYKTA